MKTSRIEALVDGQPIEQVREILQDLEGNAWLAKEVHRAPRFTANPNDNLATVAEIVKLVANMYLAKPRTFAVVEIEVDTVTHDE